MKKFSLPILVIILTAIAAVIAIIAISPKEGDIEQGEKLTKLKLGIIPIAEVAQIFVAQEKGFFNEVGLEVELIPMAGGAIIAPAVASGDIDIGFSNTVSLVVAHDKDFDFRILTTGIFRDSSKKGYGNFLVVSNDIETPKDLEGQKFAINTFGNVNELIIKAWTSKNNVDFDKISIVEVPFPEIEAALENDQIAGALVEEPFRTLIVNHGVGKVLDEKAYEVIGDRILLATWFSTASWAEQNEDTLRAFMSAVNKATDYILSHPEELHDILPRHTKLTEELSSQIIMPLFDREIQRSDLQSVIDATFEYGFISDKFDAENIIVDGLQLQ